MADIRLRQNKNRSTTQARGVALTMLTTKTHEEGSQKQCYKCGNQYIQNYLQSSPAKDKICAKFAKRGHFAKVCRATQVNYLEDTQVDQQEELDTESLETENDPVAFADFFPAMVGTIIK